MRKWQEMHPLFIKSQTGKRLTDPMSPGLSSKQRCVVVKIVSNTGNDVPPESLKHTICMLWRWMFTIHRKIQWTPLFWIFTGIFDSWEFVSKFNAWDTTCHDLMEGEGVMFVVLDSGYKNGLLTQLWYMLQTGLPCWVSRPSAAV